MCDGKVDDDFARGIAEDLPEAFVEVEFASGEIEASSLRFPGIDFLLEGHGCHIQVLQSSGSHVNRTTSLGFEFRAGDGRQGKIRVQSPQYNVLPFDWKIPETAGFF